MRKPHYLLLLFVIALPSAHATPRPDQFTPLVVSALRNNTRPFHGTDGRVHLVYELILTNTSPTPATLKKIEVLDGSNSLKALASYDGQGLLACLRTTGRLTAENPTIEFNSTRLFLIDLSLDTAIALPEHLMHQIELLGAPSPGPKPTTPVLLSYSVAPLGFSASCPSSVPRSRARAGWPSTDVAEQILSTARAIFRSTAESILLSASRLTGCAWMSLDGSSTATLQTCAITTVMARMCWRSPTARWLKP